MNPEQKWALDRVNTLFDRVKALRVYATKRLDDLALNAQHTTRKWHDEGEADALRKVLSILYGDEP
jgi:hypothetical protein